MTSIQLSRSSSLLLAALLAVENASANDGEVSDQGETDTVIVTVAGNGQPGYAGDGKQASEAQLNQPHDVAVGDDGSLYIADTNNHCVRKVDVGGVITTIAGTGGRGYSGDGGPAKHARLDSPQSLALGPDGTLFIADTKNHCVRKVDEGGVITTIAGTGKEGYSGDGGPPKKAQLALPSGIAVAPDGSVYIADWGNHRLRMISRDGNISTRAGTGKKEPFEEQHEGGSAANAPLPRPMGVAVDSQGDVYIGISAPFGRARRQACVFCLDGEGKISRVAGVLKHGRILGHRPPGDNGPAEDALLRGLEDVAVGIDGALYIAHGSDKIGRIRRVGRDGVIRPMVGSGKGLSGDQIGDGGSPLEAVLHNCSGLAVASDGTLYLADTGHNRVRRVGKQDFGERTPVIAKAGDTLVALKWDPPADKSVKAYRIYRGESRRKVAETNEPAFEDIGLSNGKSYIYYVSAVLEEGKEALIYAPTTVTPGKSR